MLPSKLGVPAKPDKLTPGPKDVPVDTEVVDRPGGGAAINPANPVNEEDRSVVGRMTYFLASIRNMTRLENVKR